MAGGAKKTPVPGMAPPTPGAAAPPARMILSVICKTAVDDIGMDTLLGDYLESGNNHGRKFFKRRQPSEDGDVLLYYWDQRDGADQSGWWFGDSVGGSQVWARNQASGNLPPASGWRVPWDGPVVDALAIQQKQRPNAKATPPPGKAPVAKAPPGKAPPTQKPVAKPASEDAAGASDSLDSESVETKLKKAGESVSLAEIEAVQALDAAKAMLEGDQSPENVKAVEESLVSQHTALMEVLKVITADASKIRVKDPKAAGELSKLQNKLRGVAMKVAQELKTVKEKSAQILKQAEEQKRRAQNEEALLQAEQRDAKLLEEALPVCMDMVTTAEDALDAVIAAAVPLEGDQFDEDMVDEANQAIKEVEAAAAKAQVSVEAARKEMMTKMAEAKKYAPEAQKVALAEYSTLLDKANEAHKKLPQYRNMRKEYEQKGESKRVMAEVSSKLGAAEVEVEKLLGSMPEGTKASEEDAKAITSSQMPTVLTSLLGALKFCEQKAASATGSLKQDLIQMKQRGDESKKKVEAFKLRLQADADQGKLEALVNFCAEKIKEAEESIEQLTVAETPFLKGVEGLPDAEFEAAIKACEEAAKKADMLANSAKAAIKTKSLEFRKFAPTSRKKAEDDMAQLQARADSASSKIVEFKKETIARKTNVLLEELLVKVADAESKLKAVQDAAKPLHGNIEELSTQALKEATEKTLEAEKAAGVAFAEAKKVFAAKQKENPGKDAVSYSERLKELNGRLNTVTADLGKERKAALAAEKICKIKVTVAEASSGMDKVEEELEKVEILTTPIGDEKPSDDKVKEMDVAVTGLQKTLTDMKKNCEVALPSALGDAKDVLTKTLARAVEAQARLDEIKATTREQTERVLCDQYVIEATKKLDKVEEAFAKTEEAEAPYLKGLDILPTDEAVKAVSESEAAMVLVQTAIAEAKTYISTKSLEIRRFMETISKPGLVKVAEFAKQNEEAVARLTEFKKETDERKRAAQLQEGKAKVDAVEEAVKKTTEAAAPLTADGAEEIQSEAAQELCEKLGAIEKTAQDKMDEARKFLNDRQREMKVSEDRAEVAKLLARLNSIQVDLAKARNAANQAEQKFVAKLLMGEVAEVMQELESAVEKATEEASPLVEEGGRDFIVASMTKMLLDALSEHVGKNGTSKEDLFLQMNNGQAESKATEAEFVAFFEKVPDMCGRPDLAFSADQLGAIFEQVDEDDDGAMSKADFLAMFIERFICSAGISITDVLDLQGDECKTLSKVEVGDILEAQGEVKTMESLGITRAKVKSLKDGVTGWVTMQGNQGTTYLEPFTVFAAFMKSLEITLAESQKVAASASSFVNAKSAELKDVKTGPLQDTKEKLTKLRPKISVMAAKLDQLKKKVEDGRKEHTKREEFERRKAAEKKDRKAAAVILKAITEKVEKAQAALAAFSTAAASLVADDPPNLDAVESPLSVQKAAKSSKEAVDVAVAAAKESLAANDERVSKAEKGPWFEAKEEMEKLSQQVSGINDDAARILSGIQTACDEIGKSKLGKVSESLRASLQASGATIESLYTELAGAGGTHIPEDKFMGLKDGAAKLGFTSEQKQLLWQQAGATSSGLGRRSFFRLLERYYRCVKEIAITSEFDIGAGDTVRKLNLQEVVEVLEGPRIDEEGEVKVPRVRAKALTDGASGWITVKGNQGTAFLQDTTRPCYYSKEAVAMQDGFASEGSRELRVLKPYEVIEVIEGPKKEEVGVAVRAKGKSSQDDAVGWFTLKSKAGVTLAQPGKSSYTTIAGIALTDNMDIKNCKVVRKLLKGEILMVTEGPLEDEASQVTRIKVKAKKDGKEGWVTIKGNSGTKYAEETGRFYSITKSTPLTEAFESDSASIRMLAEEEALELIEGPKEEKSEAPMRVHGRCVSDGTTGWVTLKGGNLEPWAPRYRCVAGTGIGDALEVGNAEALRRLEVGETIEVVEGPRIDAEVGVVRVKGRADSDGVTGWVTLAGNQGTQFLEVMIEG